MSSNCRSKSSSFFWYFSVKFQNSLRIDDFRSGYGHSKVSNSAGCSVSRLVFSSVEQSSNWKELLLYLAKMKKWVERANHVSHHTYLHTQVRKVFFYFLLLLIKFFKVSLGLFPDTVNLEDAACGQEVCKLLQFTQGYFYWKTQSQKPVGSEKLEEGKFFWRSVKKKSCQPAKVHQTSKPQWGFQTYHQNWACHLIVTDALCCDGNCWW